ncbi:MAG: molybdopterin-dependent oxidoreductase [Actinomycetota bacterium]
MTAPQMSRRALIGSAFGAVAGGSVLLALINRGSGGGGAGDLSGSVIDLRPTVPETVESLEFLTPESDFFVIDTVGKMHPRLEAGDWSLRIHGMVDKEVTLTYDDITSLPFVEHVVTLGCVSNKVGGDLIGTARWGGVYLADVLKMAGVDAAAEQLVSRSADGWTCGTPVSAVLDGRPAMLATHMNGDVLTGVHGFPVRMIVPGLFGFVSATKWVTDIDVTTWDAFDPYWLQRGWAREAPMLASSRIDIPRAKSRHAVGSVVFGGFAWAPRAGVGTVELRDGKGEWVVAEILERDTGDAWVVWRGELDLAAGEHRVAVRVIDRDGIAQDEAERDVLPSGATGLHEVTIAVL